MYIDNGGNKNDPSNPQSVTNEESEARPTEWVDRQEGGIVQGVRSYKSTDFYMQPSRYAFIAAPEDRWYVKLPDGKTWLYSEGDDPNDILIFSRPQYARQVIDRYVAGERTFGEE